MNEIFEADSASNDQEMRDESDVSEDDECADDDDVDDDESDGSYNEDPASKKRRVIKQKSNLKSVFLSAVRRNLKTVSLPKP